MAQGGMPQRKVMSVEQEMSMRQKNPMQMAQGGAVPTVEQQMMRGMPTVGSYVAPPNPMMGMQQPQPTTNVYQQQPQPQQMPTAYNEGGSVVGGNNAQNTNYSAMGNYSPANTNRFFTPPSPTGSQTGLFRPEAAASLVPQYSQRQYYNPETGEIRVVNFISGRPAPPGIPPGFVPYDPSKVVEEETKKTETAQQERGDGDGADRRDEDRQREYADSLTEMKELSELSPDFKEFVEENLPSQYKAAQAMEIDPETGLPSFPSMGFGETMKGLFSKGEIGTQLKEAVSGLFGENEMDKAYKDLAETYGLDINNYTTKGLFGSSILDKNSIREDAFLTKAVSDTFGIQRDKVSDIVARTEFERDGDGRIDPDSLVDRNTGELTQTGKDLFNQTLSDEEEADLLGRDSTSSDTTQDDIDAQGAAAAAGLGGSDDDNGASNPGGDVDSGPGSGFGYSKGGAVKPKRKKGLGRLK